MKKPDTAAPHSKNPAVAEIQASHERIDSMSKKVEGHIQAQSADVLDPSVMQDRMKRAGVK